MFWMHWKNRPKEGTAIYSLFRSMKSRLIVIYTLFLAVISLGFLITGIMAYQRTYFARATEFIAEITNQTTYNLQQNISQADFLSFSILTNSTIQQQLPGANSSNASERKLQQIRQMIWDELVSLSYSSNGLVSLSVLSDSGIEYTYQKTYGKDVQIDLEKEEIYAANGSLLWQVNDNGGRVSAARAILSLDKMEPVGYIYMVFDDISFLNIVRDSSETCIASAYIADEDGDILIRNFAEEIDSGGSQEQFSGTIDELVQAAQSARFFYGNRLSNGWQFVLEVPDSTFWRSLYSFLYIILIATAAILVLAVAVNAFVTQKIAEPTRNVLSTMDEFGQGNLSIRCKTLGDDEIGQIGRQFNKLANNIEELISEVYELELTNRQTEIEVLRMQIHPHFLYNTLDTISWLGVMRGNEDVSDLAVTLADFLRSVIDRPDFSTIEEELEGVRHYLHIQSYRFGERIESVFEVAQDAQNSMVPSFILQPLVENAIIHGIEPRARRCRLVVSVQVVDQQIS